MTAFFLEKDETLRQDYPTWIKKEKQKWNTEKQLWHFKNIKIFLQWQYKL